MPLIDLSKTVPVECENTDGTTDTYHIRETLPFRDMGESRRLQTRIFQTSARLDQWRVDGKGAGDFDQRALQQSDNDNLRLLQMWLESWSHDAPLTDANLDRMPQDHLRHVLATIYVQVWRGLSKKKPTSSNATSKKSSNPDTPSESRKS